MEDKKINKENILYETYEIKNKPEEFFDFCLRNKLHKRTSVDFTSHLEHIYKNKKERFCGLIATVAFYEGDAIGICYVQKRKDFYPIKRDRYRNVAKQFYPQSLLHNKPMQKAAMVDISSSERKIKKEYNFYFLHKGFVMFYVKPMFRNLGVGQEVFLRTEQKIINDLKYDLKDIKEIGIDPKDVFLCLTAKEKAYDMVEKNSNKFLISRLEPDCQNFKEDISMWTYKKVFEDVTYPSVEDLEKEKPKKKIKIK